MAVGKQPPSPTPYGAERRRWSEEPASPHTGRRWSQISPPGTLLHTQGSLRGHHLGREGRACFLTVPLFLLSLLEPLGFQPDSQLMEWLRDILSRLPALTGPWVSPISPPTFLIPWSPAGYGPLTQGQGEQGEACTELWVFPTGRRALCLNKTQLGTASYHVAKGLSLP